MSRSIMPYVLQSQTNPQQYFIPIYKFIISSYSYLIHSHASVDGKKNIKHKIKLNNYKKIFITMSKSTWITWFKLLWENLSKGDLI